MAVQLGMPAPDFTLRDQHGQSVSLRAFAGKRNVVAVFYPFAFSSVCTSELLELQEHLADFSDETTELLAISCDSIYSLRAFADRDGYAFSLLSDFWPHGGVSSAYGVFNDERGCAERLTVVIDRAGVVRWQVRTGMGSPRDWVAYRDALSRLL